MSTDISPEQLPVLPLAGYPVATLTSGQLSRLLAGDLARGRRRMLFFVNTNFVNQCEPLKRELSGPDAVLVNDGVGMDIASWLIHRKRFPDNLNGTDFVPALLQQLVDQRNDTGDCSADGRRDSPAVFLLGGKPGVARQAARVLQGRGVPVAGALDGFDEARDTRAVVLAMNKSGADIVLVAMGNPRQEQWILEHREALDARLLIGVGALLDFLAGDKPRAPDRVRRLRLEWLYRLSLEPRRLFRRYTIDIGWFLVRCLRQCDAGD